MQRFKNILFVSGAAADDSAAFRRAVTLAENNQARLTVIDVLKQAPSKTYTERQEKSLRELQASMVGERRHQLESMIEPDKDRIQVSAKVLMGTPFLEIIREVLRNNRDLIMKAPQADSGVKGLLFGSTDMHLLRKCPCPIWLIKPARTDHYRKILSAVDLDPSDNRNETINRQILEMSTTLALSEFSELHIVHVWQALGEGIARAWRHYISEAEVDAWVESEQFVHEGWLDNLVGEFDAGLGREATDFLKPQVHLLKGDARHVIPQLANTLQADLIVIGTVVRTGIPGFFIGNTAESILNQINCSVLAIKPEGFVTPVTLES